MASVRYIILSACQSAGLYTQFGFESEAAAWLEKQGSNPCAYVYYRQGVGVSGFDNISVAFGGSNPGAALRRVRDSLERSLEFRSDRQTEVGGFPALVMTARAKKRVYGFGGGARPVPPVPPTGSPMYFEAVDPNSTVLMTSTLTTAPILEYSTDCETWQEWQHTTAEGTHTFDTLTLTAIGDRVYLRGDNPDGLGALPEGAETPLFSHFEMTGKIAAGGNIMSLLDKDTEITEIPIFGFFILFGGISEENPNTSLTAAAAMPNVTTIGDGGCEGMYQGCTSLTAAANMSQLTTIGYRGCDCMYSGCTSLTAAAAMPNVTTIGYRGCDCMYQGCTSLTAAANMPQLTTIGDYGCEKMYEGCTSLTAAANMPQLTTIGDGGCEGMYEGCTSLTAAANMPQLTTIGDYGCEGMYEGCTFNMSDDGTTLNFDFPTPPITAGETTYSTAYDVALWMDNTNGFTNP
jgi:hypothetical protein